MNTASQKLKRLFLKGLWDEEVLKAIERFSNLTELHFLDCDADIAVFILSESKLCPLVTELSVHTMGIEEIANMWAKCGVRPKNKLRKLGLANVVDPPNYAAALGGMVGTTFPFLELIYIDPEGWEARKDWNEVARDAFEVVVRPRLPNLRFTWSR